MLACSVNGKEQEARGEQRRDFSRLASVSRLRIAKPSIASFKQQDESSNNIEATMNADTHEMLDEIDRTLLALKDKFASAPDFRRSTNIPFFNLQTCGFNLEPRPGTNYWTEEREQGLNKYGLTIGQQWRRSHRELES